MDLLILKADDIAKIITMKEVIEADKEALKIYSDGGANIPLRSNLDVKKYDGQSLYMPGYAQNANALGIKIVSVYPNNVQKNLPVVPASMLLLDANTGILKCIMDGTYLTKIRTGAVSGAATELLAKENASTFLLIGTGGQAESQLEAVVCVRPIKEIYVADIDMERAKEFAKKMKQKFSSTYDFNITPVANANEIVPKADIITLVTTSSVPVFDGSLIKKGTHINAVGSYTPNMQELPEEALVKADLVYVDTRDGVLNESGDFLTPIKKGIFNVDKDLTGELGELVANKTKARENEQQITVFESTGTAVLDIVVAQKIYENAIKIGTIGSKIQI